MNISLNASTREEKNPRALRAESKIPVELYGPDIKNQSLSVDYNEFVKIYEEAGESSLVTLKTPDGKDINTIITAVQRHPVNGRYSHIDFRQVSMTEKIEAEAELSFIGEAPAVKDLGGIFAPAKNTLIIKALPSDLVSEIEIDISSLATFGDKITVGDVKLPQGVEAAEDANVMIASVSEPREEESTTEERSVESVEVEGEKKEETAEGGEASAEEKKEE